jgi:hypothetical protein
MTCRSTKRREKKFILTSEQHRARAKKMRQAGKIEAAEWHDLAAAAIERPMAQVTAEQDKSPTVH